MSNEEMIQIALTTSTIYGEDITEEEVDQLIKITETE